MGNFGEKFRKERERRGLTLDDVSNVTKINSRMLRAIEGEHFDQLPGGVFNKGFVRAYAKHLGFNDEEAIADYLAVLREAQIGAQIGAQTAESHPGHRTETRLVVENRSEIEPRSVMSPPNSPTVARKTVEIEMQPPIVRRAAKVEPQPETAGSQPCDLHDSNYQFHTPTSNGRPGGIPWKTPAIVLAIIVAGIGLWGRHSRNVRAAQENPPQERTRQIPSSAASFVEANATSRDLKSAAMAAPMTSSAPGAPAGPTDSPAPDPVPAAPPVITAAKQAKASESTDVTVRTFDSRRTTTETAKAPGPFTVMIRATNTSWISVVADGQAVSHETLIAPAHTSVRANREIVVKVGNAAGVGFLLNGKEIAPQGDDGEVKTYVFDTRGMRTIAPGQAAGAAGPAGNDR